MADEIIRISSGVTNSYLLPCRGGYLLADTGPKKEYKRFRDALEKRGIGYDKIRYLFLTHHHDDHAGFAARLVQETGCRVIAHKDAISCLREGKTEDTMQPLNKRIEVALSIFRKFEGDFSYPPLYLKGENYIISGDEEDLLMEIGIQGRILYTPGHTSDSISILMNNGDFIAGDLTMNLLKCRSCRYHPIYMEDLKQVYASWEKIKSQGAKTVYPSHGKPFGIDQLRYPLSNYISH